MVNGSLALDNQQNDLQLIGIANKPVKYCSVALSDVIARGKRLEASVFDVEAKQARQIIEYGKYPAKMLSGNNGFVDSYVCSRFKRIWVEKSDFPIFQPSSICDIKPTPDGYISFQTKTDIEALRVHRGQILMTCSGTIGKVSFVSDTLDGKIFSHDLLRVDCKIPEDQGYIYAYLKSKIGNKILLTNSYGAVVTHIEPEHLMTVPIPDAPDSIKKRINRLIVQSYELRDESNKLLDQAEEMLMNELHLPDISDFNANLYRKNADLNTFSVKLSDIAGRVDASYHVPIVNAIIDHMNRFAEEITTVGDPRISEDVILPGRFKRVYVDKEYGVRFLGGREIHQLDPSTKKYLSRKAHLGQIEKELGIKPYSILTPARGSLGDVELPCDHFIGWAISDNMMQIVSNKEMCGYIYIFLNTEYGKTLIRRFTYGGVVDAIEPEHIKQVEIPFLKDKILQQAINELALDANKRRYEAYKLEQQALKIMDEEVIFAK